MTETIEDIAARTLTDTQLITWALHHHHGLSVREIARRRGVAPSTVRDCLEACDRAIEREKEATIPETRELRCEKCAHLFETEDWTPTIRDAINTGTCPLCGTVAFTVMR